MFIDPKILVQGGHLRVLSPSLVTAWYHLVKNFRLFAPLHPAEMGTSTYAM